MPILNVKNKLTQRTNAGFSGDNIALHDQKIIYIAIPKVANSSLKSAFLHSEIEKLPPDLKSEMTDKERDYSPLVNKTLRRHFQDKGIIVHRNEIIKGYANY